MPNKPTHVKTNNIYKSYKDAPMKVITFEELKLNYPSNDPCDQNMFKNQCAIKLSVCFQKAGVSLKTYTGKRCWLHTDVKHALRAEEFADWLLNKYLANWPNPTDITGDDWQKKANGMTGVIFFKDYWLRDKEKSPTGDHIDLWDKDKLVSGGLVGFSRFVLGINSINLSTIHNALQYSDLGKSKKILIWMIK